MTYRKRALTALAAGAIALPFLASPALAAPGDTPIPEPRPIAGFCANPTASQFVDVVASGDANANELALAVRCLATAGIAQGGPEGRPANQYGPQLPVLRGQMASFIARMLDAAAQRELQEGNIRELPAATGAYPFPGDAAANDDNATHRAAIQRLAAANIVSGNPGTASQPNGIGANRFGPNLPVTRSQMASFLNRAVAFATGGNPAQAGTAGNGFAAPNAEYYVDAQQATHAANVNGITSARIANGVGNKQYNGLGTVSRQQMARFIARTLATLFTSDGGQRIGGLQETLTSVFDDASRSTATRLAAGAIDAAQGSERTFTATGLASGVEYRITLVKASQVQRGTGTANTGTNEVRFAVGAAAGDFFLVNTGTPTADIVSVNGAPAQDNQQAGGALTTNDPNNSRTAVAKANAGGGITFTIEGEDAEDVIAVLYINGGGTQSSYVTGGGASRALEVDAQGRPVEQFGLSGVTRFVNPS